MEKKSKKSILIGITCLFIIIILLLGITYAYYRTRIIANESTDPSISVISKKMEITYGDISDDISVSDFEPNDTYTKTFTITNTGNTDVSYGVYLQDVINEFTRVDDIKLTLTCSTNNDNNTCSGVSINYPKIDTLLASNELKVSNEVHTYTLKLEYINLTDTNQSIDMDKSLSGRIQIFDLTNSLKEGTFAYKLINNAMTGAGSTIYRNVPLSIPAQETTLIQTQTVGTQKTVTPNPNYYYSYSAEVEYNELAGYTLVNPQVDKWSDIVANPQKLAKFKYTRRVEGAAMAGERTAAINDTNKIISATENLITYQVLAITPTTEVVESTMSATIDDFGISYYYRGDVQDNYVNYNGMCWRVVRILGDGSVKLILQSNSECSATMNNDYGISSSYGGDYDKVSGTYTADYLDPDYTVEDSGKQLATIRAKFAEWFNSKSFDTSDLRTGDWCLEENSIAYNVSYPYEKYTKSPIQLISEGTKKFNFGAYIRFYRSYPEQATLLCENRTTEDKAYIFDDYIGTLTADEALFAGAKNGFYSKNYLMAGNDAYNWFLLTVVFHSTMTGADYDSAAIITSSGQLSVNMAASGKHIRPAIILKNNIAFDTTRGNGTIDNPYIIN